MARPLPSGPAGRRSIAGRGPGALGRGAPRRRHHPRVVVLGDLVVDVVLAPASALVVGSDVPGRVMLRQGGSAATAARWLGRAGARVSLVSAVGHDAPGRALLAAMRAEGVVTRAVRIAGERTGRIGVLVDPGGERSFVQDRGAALRLAPGHLREAWFARAELLHLPAYSLLDPPLGDAGRRAAELAHAEGALVSVDLASGAPLAAVGRRAAIELIRGAAPDLLFAAGTEARAVAATDEALLELAPIVVLKRGAKGATILVRADGRVVRLDVATRAVPAADTTGAGDAFDAGFILGWLGARGEGAPVLVALRRGALAGHRLAARQLLTPRRELPLG